MCQLVEFCGIAACSPNTVLCLLAACTAVNCISLCCMSCMTGFVANAKRSTIVVASCCHLHSVDNLVCKCCLFVLLFNKAHIQLNTSSFFPAITCISSLLW